MDEIGKWYEDQRKKADNIREKIVRVKAHAAAYCLCTAFTICIHCKEGEKEIEQLEKELEQALYVGD